MIRVQVLHGHDAAEVRVVGATSHDDAVDRARRIADRTRTAYRIVRSGTAQVPYRRRGGVRFTILAMGDAVWLKKSLSKFKKNDSTHSHTIHLVTGASVTAAHDEWESVLLSALLPTLE